MNDIFFLVCQCGLFHIFVVESHAYVYFYAWNANYEIKCEGQLINSLTENDFKKILCSKNVLTH